MSDQERISLQENEHLQRHFAESLTVGSKFLPAAKDFVIREADDMLKERFSEIRASGQDAGRVVFQMEFDEPVGTDALIALDTHAKHVEVVRDAGTPNENIVKAVQSDAIPQTNIVTVVAGPYGPTGKWGLYTMFPGNEAPPFPNERQPEDVRRTNEQFWANHGFLATKEEIAANRIFNANINSVITAPPQNSEQSAPSVKVKNGMKNG